MLNPGAGKWGWFGNILKPVLDVFAVGNHVNSRATSCVYSSLYLPLLFSNRKSRLLNPQIFFCPLIAVVSYSQQEEAVIFCLSREGSLPSKSFSMYYSRETVLICYLEDSFGPRL